MTCLVRRLLATLATLLVAAHAHAFEAGWMQIQTAGATPDAPQTTVALYYPTLAAPRLVAMGPFSVDAAIGGKPVDHGARCCAAPSSGPSGRPPWQRCWYNARRPGGAEAGGAS